MGLYDSIKAIVLDVINSLQTLKLDEIRSVGKQPLRMIHESGAELELRQDGKAYYNDTEIGAGSGGDFYADGSVPMTGNLAMGANIITGLGAHAANGNAVRYEHLAADEHTQYLLIDGTRAMSDDLDIGNNYINNCNIINMDAGFHPAAYIKPIFTDPTYDLKIWGESEIMFFNGSLGSESESVSITTEHLDTHGNVIVNVGAHAANGNAVRYEHLAADEHTQYYNSVRHTKAIHDTLNIDADTLDGLNSLDFVNKDGSVAMSGALPMGTNKITGLGAPSVDTDAATKKYVDDNAGGVGDFLANGSVAMTGDINIGNNEIDNCNKINMDAGFHPAAYINPVFTNPTYDLKIWGESEIMFFNGSLASETESVSITSEHLDLHSSAIVNGAAISATSLDMNGGAITDAAIAGTNNTLFIIDQDNAGAGASSSLRFNRGSTDGDAAIWWNETDDEFQFESDVGVTVGNIKVAAIAASKVVTGDHGSAATDEVINVCYGTSATPPTASNTTEGALYIQYTA